MTAYKYGCPDCDWWDEGYWDEGTNFGNCPSCGQRKTVWNMTAAEEETNHELQLEEQAGCHDDMKFWNPLHNYLEARQ